MNISLTTGIQWYAISAIGILNVTLMQVDDNERPKYRGTPPLLKAILREVEWKDVSLKIDMRNLNVPDLIENRPPRLDFTGTSLGRDQWWRWIGQAGQAGQAGPGSGWPSWWRGDDPWVVSASF